MKKVHFGPTLAQKPLYKYFPQKTSIRSFLSIYITVTLCKKSDKFCQVFIKLEKSHFGQKPQNKTILRLYVTVIL